MALDRDEIRKAQAQGAFFKTRRLALGMSAALLGTMAAGGVQAQGVHGFRDRVKRQKDNPDSKSFFDTLIPGGNKPAEAPPLPPSAQPKLLQSVAFCLEQGEVARDYCHKALNNGDASLRLSLDAIQAMLPVVGALGKLAELNAARLKDMAKISLLFLADCEKECRDKGQSHAVVKNCAQACAVCMQECRTVLSA